MSKWYTVLINLDTPENDVQGESDKVEIWVRTNSQGRVKMRRSWEKGTRLDEYHFKCVMQIKFKLDQDCAAFKLKMPSNRLENLLHKSKSKRPSFTVKVLKSRYTLPPIKTKSISTIDFKMDYDT